MTDLRHLALAVTDASARAIRPQDDRTYAARKAVATALRFLAGPGCEQPISHRDLLRLADTIEEL